MLHPTIAGRTKNVPDEFVEKYLEHGWTKAPEPALATKKRPAKKAATPSIEA